MSGKLPNRLNRETSLSDVKESYYALCQSMLGKCAPLYVLCTSRVVRVVSDLDIQRNEET